MVVLQKASDAPLVTEAGLAAGWRRVFTHVAGEPGAPTPSQLKRVRRSPDAAKRRMPVLVWAHRGDDEDLWRNAGAYVARGPASRAAMQRAMSEILRGDVAWIETASYVGPCRRHKTRWLGGPSRRLSDAAVQQKTSQAAADTTSFATQMRQIRHGAFGFAKADRDRRGQFLADVRRTRAAAERSRTMHAVAALDSLARYIAASGADGRVDEALIERHLDIADGPAVDAPSALAEIARAVDVAIGLRAAG
ncbi:MAG: hypothetical protein AB7O04_11755 [Hyphomonadaceae bacterium]